MIMMSISSSHVGCVCEMEQSHGRQNGNAVPSAHTEPAAYKSHSQHTSELPQQAAVAAARHGEGSGGVQELPTR